MSVTVPNYESMLQEFYQQILRHGDCCMDVGAHTGRHTLPMARCVGRGGQVHAFEPLPHAANQLRQRIADLDENSDGAVTVHQAALSCQPGRRTFLAIQEAPEYSGLKARHYDRPVTTEQIEVEVHKLDDYADSIQDIAFIKIDTEGGELDVLRGGHATVQRDQPVISFEFGDNAIVEYPYDSRDMFGFFADLGYSVTTITGQELDLGGFVESAALQHVWDYVACHGSKRELLDAWLHRRRAAAA